MIMMTQKDIDRIENAINHIKCAADPWAAEVAIEAMRKQIPQRPEYLKIIKNSAGYIIGKKGECPCCGSLVYNPGDMYVCNFCGQAICWEGE